MAGLSLAAGLPMVLFFIRGSGAQQMEAGFTYMDQIAESRGRLGDLNRTKDQIEAKMMDAISLRDRAAAGGDYASSQSAAGDYQRLNGALQDMNREIQTEQTKLNQLEQKRRDLDRGKSLPPTPSPQAPPPRSRLTVENNFTRAKRMVSAYTSGDKDLSLKFKGDWWGAADDSEGNIRELVKELDGQAYAYYRGLRADAPARKSLQPEAPPPAAPAPAAAGAGTPAAATSRRPADVPMIAPPPKSSPGAAPALVGRLSFFNVYGRDLEPVAPLMAGLDADAPYLGMGRISYVAAPLPRPGLSTKDGISEATAPEYSFVLDRSAHDPFRFGLTRADEIRMKAAGAGAEPPGFSLPAGCGKPPRKKGIDLGYYMAFGLPPEEPEPPASGFYSVPIFWAGKRAAGALVDWTAERLEGAIGARLEAELGVTLTEDASGLAADWGL